MSPDARKRLIKLLNMTSSTSDHEALSAVRRANELLKKEAVNWEQLVSGKSELRVGASNTRSPFGEWDFVWQPPPPPGPNPRQGFKQAIQVQYSETVWKDILKINESADRLAVFDRLSLAQVFLDLVTKGFALARSDLILIKKIQEQSGAMSLNDRAFITALWAKGMRDRHTSVPF